MAPNLANVHTLLEDSRSIHYRILAAAYNYLATMVNKKGKVGRAPPERRRGAHLCSLS